MNELECQKCHHTWISIKGDPKVCPRCKSYNWKDTTTTYKKDAPETIEPPTVINVDLDKINFPDASQLQDPNFGLVRARPTGKCEMPNVACKGIGYPHLVTFQTDEGEVTNEYFLCDNHLASARKKYKVREI